MKYEAPICELLGIDALDIICTSDVTGNAGGLTAFGNENPNGDTPNSKVPFDL
ncbi:MAG: hypothetical protein IJY18_03760 [Clostridia bacterium]|nr:hypothetical protein [Clostridia bacterium]